MLVSSTRRFDLELGGSAAMAALTSDLQLLRDRDSRIARLGTQALSVGELEPDLGIMGKDPRRFGASLGGCEVGTSGCQSGARSESLFEGEGWAR